MPTDPESPASTAHIGAGTRPLRRLWRIGRLLLLGYLVVLLMMTLWENRLIFFPVPFPSGDWNPRDLPVEDAWFHAADGTQLHGWYVPVDQPRAVVLFAHGNAGNLTHRRDALEWLTGHARASVLMFDYRGYGRSQGSPTVEGVLSDTRAARDWLSQRAGVAPAQIVLMGESLGGAVMIDLAAELPPRGLIVENAFSSLSDVAAYHYPWLPIRLLMRSKLDPVAQIGKYRGPLLQLHGQSDRIVPLALAERLHEAANQPKQLVIVPHGDHNDVRTPLAYRAIDEFIETLPQRAP